MLLGLRAAPRADVCAGLAIVALTVVVARKDILSLSMEPVKVWFHVSKSSYLLLILMGMVLRWKTIHVQLI